MGYDSWDKIETNFWYLDPFKGIRSVADRRYSFLVIYGLLVRLRLERGAIWFYRGIIVKYGAIEIYRGKVGVLSF
jgi:hypothetical protein